MENILNGSWTMGSKGYSPDDVRKLLWNKMVVFVGDSVVRGMYKDLVKLLENGEIMTKRELKAKGEHSYTGDRLVEGGILNGLCNGKSYIEVREYRTDHHCIRFYFITRVFYDYVETILQDFAEQPVPDILYVASCCWDVTRWSDEIKYGEDCLSKYKANLNILFKRLGEVLPSYTLNIFGCCLPMGDQVRGGFLEKGFEYKQETLRLDILEANYFASEIAKQYRVDVIDFHYFFRHHQECREPDGIHWNATAHRNMTLMLLTHCADSWGISLIPSKKYRCPLQGVIGSKVENRMSSKWQVLGLPTDFDDNQRSYYRNKIARHNDRADRPAPYSRSNNRSRPDAFNGDQAHQNRIKELQYYDSQCKSSRAEYRSRQPMNVTPLMPANWVNDNFNTTNLGDNGFGDDFPYNRALNNSGYYTGDFSGNNINNDLFTCFEGNHMVNPHMRNLPANPNFMNTANQNLLNVANGLLRNARYEDRFMDRHRHYSRRPY